MTEALPLPDFVDWPIFPFEGDRPCYACPKGDEGLATGGGTVVGNTDPAS